MIVYVESNYVLEMACLQEEHESCEELLNLGESGQIRLALPAYCVIETKLSLPRRDQRRRDLHVQLNKEIRELSRSRPYQELAGAATELTRTLIQSGQAEQHRLELLLARLIPVCDILPLDVATINAASQGGG